MLIAIGDKCFQQLNPSIAASDSRIDDVSGQCQQGLQMLMRHLECAPNDQSLHSLSSRPLWADEMAHPPLRKGKLT